MTSRQHYPVLFHRHPANPILTAADWPYPAHTVFNAGATRLADGSTLLLWPWERYSWARAWHLLGLWLWQRALATLVDAGPHR